LPYTIKSISCLFNERLLFLFLLLILVEHQSFSQLSVAGSYVQEDGSPIPYANVLLLNAADSSLQKGDVTGSNGHFNIQLSEDGRYLLSIKFIGFQPYYSDVFTLNSSSRSKDFGEITGFENTQQLDEVVVEGEKPLFEQKIDRTVVNVENNIAASGGSALDVLERSPGVTVDRINNSVALAGKQGVRVMINGKISQLPLEAAVQMLDGMSADNIEKIELITTPPAKYEAQGDAGMINIVTKKSIDKGLNGGLSVFTGYGRREKYGGNIIFNGRSKDVNVYGDYSYNMNVTEQLFTIDRSFTDDGDNIRFATKNNRDAFTRVHNGRIGVDWNIGEKTTIGVLGSIFDRHWEMDKADANIIEHTNGVQTAGINMSTVEINDWILLLGNFNITHDFNNKHSLSFDLDHIYYDSDNPTDYVQNFFDTQGSLTNSSILLSRKQTPINTWVSKIDYTYNINDKITFEAGGKVSLSDLENIIVVENEENDQLVIDNNLSSDAKMIENIGAGYVASTIDVSEKIDLQIGLRYEHTITNIDTQAEADIVDRNFGNWFPSTFFQYTINKNNSYVISYSRRITRPSFFQIAPFVIFLSPNTFWSGNESLLPALTDAVKAEYRYKSFLLSFQYSHDKNSISLFQPRLNEENQQVSKAENLDYRNNYSINFSFPVNLARWWEFQFNTAYNYIINKATYLSEPIELSVQNFTINGQSKIKLPKDFTFEISGFYNSKQLFGVSEMGAFGALTLGLEKKLLNGSIRASYSDLFDTNQWLFQTNLSEENLNAETLIDFETRIFRLTYSTTFGNRKLKVNKRSKTGSEEEQRRFQ